MIKVDREQFTKPFIAGCAYKVARMIFTRVGIRSSGQADSGELVKVPTGRMIPGSSKDEMLQGVRKAPIVLYSSLKNKMNYRESQKIYGDDNIESI